MPYLEEVMPAKMEYQIKWVHQFRSEVHASRYVNGERHVVGCVFTGTDHSCRKYLGSKISPLAIVDGRVVDSKLANVFNRSLDSLETK